MPEEEAQSIGCSSVAVFIGLLLLGVSGVVIAASRTNTTRQFLYIGSEPKKHESIGWERKKMYPLHDPFHGVRFAPGTTLELLGGTDRTFTVTGSDGSLFTFESQFWVPGWGASFPTVDYEVMRSPWDNEKGRPFCVSDPAHLAHAYLLWVGSAKWRYLLIGIVAVALIALASAENRYRLWALPLVAVLLAVASNTRAPDERCALRPQLVSYRTASGHIRPVPDYRIVAPYGDKRGYDQTFRPVPIVCLSFLHAILAVSLFPALRGAHYLLVPHPAEQHVRRRPGKPSEINVAGFDDSLGKENIHNLPPDFVLKNKARRIRNLADLVRAETEAADEVERHQRATISKEK